MIKLLSTILAAMLIFSGAAVPTAGCETDPSETYVTIQGIIMELDENGFLVQQDEGDEVYVHLSDETVNELETLSVGMYVNVDYNGMMTRSLPPQITALRIFGAVLEGIITEITSDSLLLNTDTIGDVIVHLPEGMSAPVVGMHVRVYFNGVMALSLPGQITAQFIETIPSENARD